jgi:hypothetical protein
LFLSNFFPPPPLEIGNLVLAGCFVLKLYIYKKRRRRGAYIVFKERGHCL